MLFLIITHLAYAELSFDKYIIEDSVSSAVSEYAFAFNLKNTGGNTIKITDISSSCACTVASLEKKSYAPNESGILKGVFRIGGKVGTQENEILLQTDNLGQSKIKLMLRVHIEKLLEAKPSLLFWRKSGDPAEKLATVKLGDLADVKIVSIESDNESFSAKHEPSKDSPKQFILKVSPKSTNEPARGMIKIKAKAENQAEKTFFIHTIIK